MKVVQVSKQLFNPISLPGMGRSVEATGLSQDELAEIRGAYSRGELYIEFIEEPGETLRVKQLWANPHSPQVTLFV